MKRINVILCLLPFYLLLFASTISFGAATSPGESGESNSFIGAETCKECHEEQYESYAKTIHSRKAIKGPATQDAYESCHGAGALHVEKGGGRGVDIFAFNDETAASDRSAKCLQCHQTNHDMDLWEVGAHSRNEVSCDSCHDLHAYGGDQRPEEPEICFSCHRDVRVDANKRSRHAIIEGKISCTSCHEPHGSISEHMVKADDPQQLCYSCHTDKRGPYIYEHPPVEENCRSCHTPHGSIHAKLLTEKLPNLCQDCHTWSRHPGTPYDGDSGFTGRSPSNRFFARSCLNCHGAIHGGNTFENHALTR